MMNRVSRFVGGAILVCMLAACGASIPRELIYQSPTLPHGSSNIQGYQKKHGLLAGVESIRILQVDGKYVNGYEGAPTAKQIRLVEGVQMISVAYSLGTDFFGSGEIKLSVKPFTDYVVRFEETSKNSDDQQRNDEKGESTAEKPFMHTLVWVEDKETGKPVTEKVKIKVEFIPQTEIPVIIFI